MEPIKTEMQQLEENARRQQAKDKATDITKRLLELLEIESKKLRWYMRSHTLVMIVMLAYFIILGILLFSSLGADTVDTYLDFTFLIWVVAIARSNWHEARWQRARGDRKGFEEALVMLGMLDVEECDCDNCKKKKKIKVASKSPFKRFKEFFERMGSKKPEEAYA